MAQRRPLGCSRWWAKVGGTTGVGGEERWASDGTAGEGMVLCSPGARTCPLAVCQDGHCVETEFVWAGSGDSEDDTDVTTPSIPTTAPARWTPD